MSFGDAVKTCFSKYVTFDGRAARPEYWYWVLFVLIVSVVLGIIDMLLPYRLLQIIFELAIFLPGLAVMFRRLHDIDRSAWWWLILFIPIVGAILMIVWLCQRGTDGPNRFGPVPA
jgi:uncharacterized membrane protein YhaH (DUF805 family)